MAAQVTIRLTLSQTTLVKGMIEQALEDAMDAYADGTVDDETLSGLDATDRLELAKEISDYRQILKEF
jgi:hypothetical protein